MAFVLTLIYIFVSLVSPQSFAPAIAALHVAQIFGILAIVATALSLSGSNLAQLAETWLILGFFLAANLSILMTGYLGGVLVVTSQLLPSFLVFYFILASCRQTARLKTLAFTLIAISLFIMVQGALAYNAGNWQSDYITLERVENVIIFRARGMGFLSDPNDLGQLFVAVVPLLYLLWRKKRFVYNFFVCLLPTAALLYGIFITHSRGAIIALVAIVIIASRKRLGIIRTSMAVGIMAMLLIAVNASGGRNMSDDDGDRVGAWFTGLELFKAHPIFGVGIDKYIDNSGTGQTAHNSYVLCISELGLFGYFFFMGIITTSFLGLNRIIRLEEEAQAGTLPEPEPEPWQRHLTPAVLAGPANALAAPQSLWMKRAPAMPASAWALPAGNGLAGAAGTSFTGPAASDSGSFAFPSESEPGAPLRFGDEVEDLNFALYAKVLRTSLVGLLTAGFFISRTYSMPFFIIVGMATALRSIYLVRRPESAVPRKTILKRTWIVIFASLLGLYLLIRFSGSGH